MSNLELQLIELKLINNPNDVTIAHIEVLQQLINLMYENIIDMPEWLIRWTLLRKELDNVKINLCKIE